MAVKEGSRPVSLGWRDSDLSDAIDERFRMVVADRGLAPTLAVRPAGAIRFSQREIPVALLTPCWSDLEVGARPVADFLIGKPSRVTQSRRVVALACSPRTEAVSPVPKIPVGTL